MKKFDFNDYKYILNKFKIEKITYNICNSQDIPIHKFYRYVIKKKNNERIRFDGRKSYFKTFKKAALALLREKGIIDESKDNKMAKFYNYEQDKESIDELHKRYSHHNDIMSDYCFLYTLKEFNGHMSKAIIDYIITIDGDWEYSYSNYTDDYIKELIFYQIPPKYYKNEYFISNIPKYARLMSREFYYTKKGEEHYGEEITDSMRKKFDYEAEKYEILMYREVSSYMNN